MLGLNWSHLPWPQQMTFPGTAASPCSSASAGSSELSGEWLLPAAFWFFTVFHLFRSTAPLSMRRLP